MHPKLLCSKFFTLSTERERIQREKLRDLAVFERLNGNPRKSSPALAVKKVWPNCIYYLMKCDIRVAFYSQILSSLRRMYPQAPW